MSSTYIPPKIKTQLWTLSGGRCEYRGCNKALWRDNLTMGRMNTSYIAHIVADKKMVQEVIRSDHHYWQRSLVI
jgi:hypothetical protein